MSDEVFLGHVKNLLQNFIGTLDRRDFDAWLKIFAADGYYAVIRNIELVDDDNVLLIGEDMKRLSARIASGITRDLRRSVHLIGWVIGNAAQSNATASFALWLDGKPSTAGRYELELVAEATALKIKKCTAVLDTIDIIDTIYLPI